MFLWRLWTNVLAFVQWEKKEEGGRRKEEGAMERKIA